MTVVNAKSYQELVAKVMAIDGGMVVIAGHSNTVAEIIQAFGGPDGIVIADPEYNHLYLLSYPRYSGR